MFHTKWASHHDFQRTRGVLRLLASIVSDLWQRQQSLTGNTSLIHTSDINFAIADADIVVAAASVSQSFIDVKNFFEIIGSSNPKHLDKFKRFM